MNQTMPGHVALAMCVDTKCLKEGATHAPELEGMHYMFAVIPQKPLPDILEPEPELFLKFHNEVPKGKVVARYILRAEGEWGQAANEYKQGWNKIMHQELTCEDEPQLVPIFGLLMAPPDSLTKQQKKLFKNDPIGLERFHVIAKHADNWAKHMAMTAFEALHSREKQQTVTTLKADCKKALQGKKGNNGNKASQANKDDLANGHGQ